MGIRPGSRRSLLAGVVMLLVMVASVAMMRSFACPPSRVFSAFVIICVPIEVIGASIAFYSEFSKDELPLYELDPPDSEESRDLPKAEAFCPKCGRPVSENDQFYRSCGAPLNFAGLVRAHSLSTRAQRCTGPPTMPADAIHSLVRCADTRTSHWPPRPPALVSNSTLYWR